MRLRARRAGFLKLDGTDFELRPAVDEACQVLVEQARAKGLSLDRWVAGDVPITVHGDRTRLRQILRSLLSNAVKFTASGEVVVRIRRGKGDIRAAAGEASTALRRRLG